MADVATVRQKASTFRDSTAVGYRAAENGHQLAIRREGKRYRIACSCGFITRWNYSRKAAFGETYDHAIAAANGDIPGVSLPENPPNVAGL